jgi:cell division protein FtsN
VFGAQAWMQHVDRQRATPPQQSRVAVPAPPVVRSTQASSPPAIVPDPTSPAPATAQGLAPASPTPEPVPASNKPASAGPAAATAVTAAGESGSRFEIVVGSFRSESRATEVAAMVTAAGLTVRQRATGGWQQVIAGPFASREEADKAQQRLRGAGFTDTQTVAASR